MEINIQEIIGLAKDAGKEILEIYNTQFKVEEKESETFAEGVSPLTEADVKSNEIIVNGLKKYEIPMLTEENKQVEYNKRKDWKEFWLVDPLDGTKEFVKQNGEFTVNIALIKEGKPILGVVYVPTQDLLYYSDENGAFKKKGEEDAVKLESSKEMKEPIRVVASKSHFNEETKQYIEGLGKEFELVNKGSSLKLCMVAEGSADIYPRLGSTMEWDTGAAHAVVNGSGKKVINFETDKELEYNKENLLNPWFIVK